jgi:hypothetical protein
MGKTKELFREEREQYDEYRFPSKYPVSTKSVDTGLTLQTKKLLTLTKSDIRDYAITIVDSVQNGEQDLIETMISVKKAISFFEQLDENLRPLFYSKQIVSKGDILKVHNVEIEPSDFSKWDFKNCNDEILNRICEDKKDRENALKLITSPTKYIDTVTGSEYVANPPIKKTTSGYKITINA